MWDMANDKEYIKIRNKTGGGWRQNNKMNTVRVMCGGDILADLPQREFWKGFCTILAKSVPELELLLLPLVC